MKSFDDVLNILANSHYDMRELVAKWQEMLSPDPAEVVFRFFDGAEFKVENFASIRKHVENAISNYGNVALMTDGDKLNYNNGSLLIGTENGPHIAHRVNQVIGYRQKNLLDGGTETNGNFGINVAQVWGTSLPDAADRTVGAVANTDMWGLDADRVQGRKFEITGGKGLNRDSGSSGVWISSDGLQLRGGNPDHRATVDHNGVRGVTSENKEWEYGVRESQMVKSLLSIADAIAGEPGSAPENDDPCKLSGNNINLLQNVQYHSITLRLEKGGTISGSFERGDNGVTGGKETFAINNNGPLVVQVPPIFDSKNTAIVSVAMGCPRHSNPRWGIAKWIYKAKLQEGSPDGLRLFIYDPHIVPSAGQKPDGSEITVGVTDVYLFIQYASFT